MNRSFDVIIVGSGLVGASLALALGEADLSVALVEPNPPRPLGEDNGWDVRIYAISPGSAAFLAQCEAWQRIPVERIARVETMHVYGDEPGSRLDFSAYDTGLRELAFIVENRLLQHALWAGLKAADHVALFTQVQCASLVWERSAVVLRLADGSEINAKLVVGADGGDSWVRAEAGIAANANTYGELGVVANFATTTRHRGIAYQWFRHDGVLALLPLPGERVSMVWSTPEEHGNTLLALAADELVARVDDASGQILGLRERITPAAAFPLQRQRTRELVGPRLALVGDAAHNVHPLAGQGVNLGFRDARTLARVMRERGAQRDCGDYYLLRRYERARREDIIALEWVTDGLHRLFAGNNAGLARLRNIGLKLVNAQSPLKKLLVRQAVA